MCECRGFVVSVVRDLGLPVKLVGVGEKIDDLRDFQPEVRVLVHVHLCIFNALRLLYVPRDNMQLFVIWSGVHSDEFSLSCCVVRLVMFTGIRGCAAGQL